MCMTTCYTAAPMDNIWLALALVISYLCGSIPFGLLIGWARGVDLRTVGSGNIGATNCGRVLGKPWGTACFLLDLIKGFVPVFVAGLALGLIGREARGPATTLEWGWLLVAAMAVLGHVFPIWLGFRGGKGVATGLGAILGVWPYLTLPALGAAATWVLFAATLRYVGLASVVAVTFLPIYVLLGIWLMGQPTARAAPYLTITCGMSLLIIWRHRGNLRRTWEGTESRLGNQVSVASSAHGQAGAGS